MILKSLDSVDARMFVKFPSSFRPDTSPNSGAGKDVASCDVGELSAFLAHFGGMSFSRGLYRTLETNKVDGWRLRSQQPIQSSLVV